LSREGESRRGVLTTSPAKKEFPQAAATVKMYNGGGKGEAGLVCTERALKFKRKSRPTLVGSRMRERLLENQSCSLKRGAAS